MVYTRTSFARAGQHNRLEPCREVIHDREIAGGDKEVADANEYGNLLLQEEGRQDRLWGNEELHEDEHDCENYRRH